MLPMRVILATTTALCCLCAAPVYAQPACELPLSAYLTDSVGAPLDGALDVELRFYDEDSAVALPVECRTLSGVSVDGGWLRLTVDACTTPAPEDCGAISLSELLGDGSDELWVGVIIGDEELRPRVPFGAVPLALRASSAGDATTLAGRGPDAFEPTGAIADHAADPSAHHSSTSDGIALTPASVEAGPTRLDETGIDFGPDADDELTADIVRTLTGGGDADALHSHAASGTDGGGCMTAWGRADCPDSFTLFYSGEIVQSFAAQQNDGSPETISLATSDVMCFDTAALPPSRSYDRSYFTWGLMRVSARVIYEGSDGLPCAVCCR